MEKTKFRTLKSSEFLREKIRRNIRYGSSPFELDPSTGDEDGHFLKIQFADAYDQTPRVNYTVMMHKDSHFMVRHDLHAIEKEYFVIAMLNESDRPVSGIIHWEAKVIPLE